MKAEDIPRELAIDLGFGDAEVALLAAAAEAVTPRIQPVIDHFYEVLSANAGLRALFADAAQIERQKVHLGGWLRGLFSGRYDADYWKSRARIGRTHVRIGLDQRYMVSMMGLLRSELDGVLVAAGADRQWNATVVDDTRIALAKLLDLELAVMVETYQEAFVRRARNGERLATIGQIAATIGHELRNPLAVIDSSLALLRRRVPEDPRIAKHLDRIGGQVKVADTIISNLLSMVRDRPPQRSKVSLSRLIADAWGSIRHTEKVELTSALDRDEVFVDPAQVRQLLVNLLQNSVQAGAERVRVTSRMDDLALVLTVDDDGDGLPEGAENWLFEPLATARDNGSGLGLALCMRIVEKHEGALVAERLPRGTRMAATLAGAAGERS
ncbi:MAG: histidine kinase [Sandaracinus sp.]|nr:histidine kinase [Sandaracinus sp.]|tara:strand:+ start:1833 stop:2984 length:1152 start_codon:yes stop_codon:yes gene_type:complete